MIRIFYGENRVKAKQEIERLLGIDYEIIEGQDLAPADLPSILKGQSLFAEKRKILIRDLSTNRSVFEKLAQYLDTPHEVIVFELKLDKRSATYKSLENKAEIKEFVLPKDPNLSLVFNIYNTAKKDGQKAIAMLEKIKHLEDPIMFAGLLATQAIKDYVKNQGTKEKKALKELSKLDIELKSAKISSWLLIESFLLRLSSL